MEVGSDEKKKLVTATRKGAAVLDQWLPDHIKSEYHVLQQVTVIFFIVPCCQSISFLAFSMENLVTFFY